MTTGIGHGLVSTLGNSLPWRKTGGDVVPGSGGDGRGRGVPASLAGALAYHALYDAVEYAGAITARSHLTEPLLRELGFDQAAPPGYRHRVVVAPGRAARADGLPAPGLISRTDSYVPLQR